MAEGEERWRKYIDPDGVARIPDDEFRGLLARFEEVQAERDLFKAAALEAENERVEARADLERAQEHSLTVEERQAILAAVEFYLTSHDGRHEAESGATHSGYAKLAETLAEARERGEQ